MPLSLVPTPFAPPKPSLTFTWNAYLLPCPCSLQRLTFTELCSCLLPLPEAHCAFKSMVEHKLYQDLLVWHWPDFCRVLPKIQKVK